LDRKPGRNDPCPCGSGTKYKSCCGRLQPIPRLQRLHCADPEAASSLEIQSLVALMHAGRFAELEGRARKLLEALPHSGLAWQLLGLALTRQGKDAIQAHTEAVKCQPSDPVAHLNLGNALGRAGHLKDAAASYRRALALRPDLAEAHNNLADVELELGHLEAALGSLRRAVEIRPDFAEAQQNLGKTLLRLGRYEEALESCKTAVGLAPNSPQAHNSLGNVLARLGQFDEAIASFHRCIAAQPELAEAHANLANAIRSTGRLAEAIEEYRLAVRIKPDFVEAYAELATSLRLLRSTAEAEAACHRALQIAPGTAAVLVVLAELRADLGRFCEAEDYFKQALAADPHSVEALAGMARVRRMTGADGAWLSAARRLEQTGISPQREIILRYAMGKYFDDVADFPAAFANYQRANLLARRSAPEHDRARLQRTIEWLIRSQDAAWLGKRSKAAPQSCRPVFVIGMLRSGTSLAEQILASHPAVFGAGELTFWSTRLAALLPLVPDDTSPAPDTEELARAGRDYLDYLQTMPTEAARIIDKLPTNFLAAGLINAALPGARIIHMQRDPIDTCLSIYFQHLEAINTYTHDLQDLAHYYRQYRRLMRHWKITLPEGAMLEVPYEGLVADPEGWTRRLLAFVDLPWHPGCLDFQRTQRAVVTASKWQVRQPITATSVGRWRHYEKFIDPLISLASEPV
jgi:tetratricopeptide (TPR) repeat protein